MGRRLQRFIQVQPAEIAAVGWSWLFFYAVLTSYYVIRPIRDDIGVAGGVQNLAWLFTATLTGMALANPAFGYVAARVPRARLISVGYRFFALNLIAFFALLTYGAGSHIWIGRVFFVWSAVFNMFVVSMFWSVMTDSFSTEQGKRLFGFIGAGGTIGAITGATLTSTLVGRLGAARLLLVSAVLLEIAAFAARRVFATSVRSSVPTDAERAGSGLGGSASEGFTRTVRDPYLRGIAIHLLLFTILTTFIYFEQAHIVDATLTDRVARTRFFANIEVMVNSLTLVTQSLATGHLVRIFGLTAALAFLPALSIVGFFLLGASPTVTVLMAFQVLRRSGEFSVSKPAREVLFTSAPRRDRYKAKNFIDTFVYRTGDQIGAWSYAGLTVLGLSITGVSLVGASIGAVGVGVAIWLGTWHRRQVEHSRLLVPPTSRTADEPAAP